MEEKSCGFEYEGRKCCSPNCVGIARCVDLCKVHMKQVVKDNVRRFNKGMDITKDMIFTRKLTYGETWSERDMILRNEKGGKKEWE